MSTGVAIFATILTLIEFVWVVVIACSYGVVVVLDGKHWTWKQNGWPVTKTYYITIGVMAGVSVLVLILVGVLVGIWSAVS